MELTVQEAGSSDNSSKYDPPEGVNIKGKVVRAKILDIKEKETPFWIDDEDHSKGKKMQFNFRFECLDEIKGWPESVGKWFWGSTGTVLSRHPNCHLYQWVCAIAQVDEIEAGYKVDMTDLIDLECNILLGLSKNGKPKVDQVLPLQ